MGGDFEVLKEEYEGEKKIANGIFMPREGRDFVGSWHYLTDN